MHKIHKKVLKDSDQRPIAVQIQYSDWLEVERLLKIPSEAARSTDLSRHRGVISLTEDPMQYQSRMRQEWS